MYYLVTIHKSQKLAHVETLALSNVISILHQHFVDVEEFAMEFHGKYNQLHAHLLIKVGKYFRYQNITKIGQFQLHYRLIRDNTTIPAVTSYIHKMESYGCSYINECRKHYIEPN